LRPGTYSGDVSIDRGGTRGKPIVVTSANSQEARVQGVFWVDADNVVVTRLRLDGSTTGGQPSPQINGDRVTFRDNNVSNAHTGICFIVGGDFASYGYAERTVIVGNRIHDCGRLPRTGHDHGIYLEGSRGARVTGNLIFGNADWGVHMYPEADGTYVAHNIIEGNGGGVIVAGEGAGGEYDRDHSSDHNRVELNVIANSSADPNIAVFWGGPVGVGNVARRNCVWNGVDGNVGDHEGLDLSGTIVANPRFVNRLARDFRMRAGSRCRRMGAGPRR
jgi:parallel beta-helix repeat protein